MKIILLDYQNNYVKHLSFGYKAAKSFNILSITLNILHNYFYDPNKIINIYMLKYSSFFSFTDYPMPSMPLDNY